MRHLAGNMLSRWTDLFTSDGEKPDRHRDSEFEEEPMERARLLDVWRAGWECLFAALDALQPGDLTRTVTIRGEAMPAIAAIHRQISHYGTHVGQIVLLAKHVRGARWQYISIPRGQSGAYRPSA